jgi:hypothetical protein
VKERRHVNTKEGRVMGVGKRSEPWCYEMRCKMEGILCHHSYRKHECSAPKFKKN